VTNKFRGGEKSEKRENPKKVPEKQFFLMKKNPRSRMKKDVGPRRVKGLKNLVKAGAKSSETEGPIGQSA